MQLTVTIHETSIIVSVLTVRPHFRGRSLQIPKALGLRYTNLLVTPVCHLKVHSDKIPGAKLIKAHRDDKLIERPPKRY